MVLRRGGRITGVIRCFPHQHLQNQHRFPLVGRASKDAWLKKKKQLVLQGKGSKSDYVDVYGDQAKAEVILQAPNNNARLTFQDFQGLVMWVLADGPMPKWVFIKNKPLVSKVVVLYMAGLDAAVYTGYPRLFRNLAHCCGTPRASAAVSPLATSAQTVEAILTCPQPKTMKKHDRSQDDVALLEVENSDSKTEESRFKRRKVSSGDSGVVSTGPAEGNQVCQQTRVHLTVGYSGNSAFPASYYTLTTRQMHENGYPKAEVGSEGCTLQKPPGFVTTRPAASGSKYRDMVAVDCEMCYTAKGLELTRVSLVDSEGKVLLDKLVKPANPITDYNTQYSGITSKMMTDVTTTLADIQEEILEIVAAETILVGHSAENDLLALKVFHSLVIDTALLYQHPSKGALFKPALRMLTAKFLHRKIQGDKSGHDSVDDARAAMDLTLLKIQKGPAFGKRLKPFCENLVAILSTHGRRSTLIDRRPVLHHYAVGACNAIIATSDDDVLVKVAKEAKKASVDFVWAQFSELNTYYEDRARSSEDMAVRAAEMAALMTCNKGVQHNSSLIDRGISREEHNSTCNSSLPQSLEALLTRMDERVKSLHEALLTNTLLIVLTGHGDTPSVRRLQELKWKSLQNKQVDSKRWLESNEDVLEEFAARAETTLTFACIKE